MMPPNMPMPGVNPMMRMPPTAPTAPIHPIAPNRTDSDITLIWVGKIAVGITDDVIRAILSQCGEVVNWRRTTDNKTGQAKNFGFCDFRFPEGALVALKILDGLVLGDSKLWVRVDEKTQQKLNETEERIKKEKSKDGKPAESILTPEEEEGIRKRINDIVSPINKIYQNGEDPENVGDENLIKEIKLMKARKEREEQENKKREMERKRDMELKRQKIEEEKERQKRKQERDEKEYRRRVRDFEDYQSARVRELNRRAKEDARKIELRNKDIEEDNIDDKYRRRKIRATRRNRLIERDMDIEDEEREQEELRERQMRELEEKRRREEEEKRSKEEEEKKSKQQEPVEKPKVETSQPLKLQLGTTVKAKTTAKVVPSVFGSDLEEEENVKKTKPLITPLIEDESQKVSKAQSILEKIPSEKEKLFSMEIAWDIIDKYNIVHNKIRPYITKKIVEYYGEEDEQMIDYICSRVSERVNPQEILDELSDVMEDEAQVFIPRLWRLLIYEMKLAEEQESTS